MVAQKIKIFKKFSTEVDSSPQRLRWEFHAEWLDNINTFPLKHVSPSFSVGGLAKNILDAIKESTNEKVYYFEPVDKNESFFCSLVRNSGVKEQGVAFFEKPLSFDEKIELLKALNYVVK